MLRDRSHQSRALAEKCLAIAKQTADESVRTLLLEMAQRWLDLAELREQAGWRLRAIQMLIGQELRAYYELPEVHQSRIVALLTQLTVQQDGECDETEEMGQGGGD